ncbi:MAG: SAM-dependent methyltransferase [Spirochaetales bacterium]|nr:SAM-dependent methyltransferase [Spirochaetales bacterium]
MESLKEIGRVESGFKEMADPFVMRKKESGIVLAKEYTEGLYRLSESRYIQVVYGFHLSKGYSLKGPVYSGEIKGVFASRSPHRPSPLGVTTVELLNIEGNRLVVKGLDAVDGSPVYDIKPHASVFDEAGTGDVDRQWAYTEPRSEMIKLVRGGDLKACLLLAGTLHGHFCPGLSSGIYASVEGMKRMSVHFSDGMEQMLAIIEINSCFADGIQAVTGCTFGNNSLIYRDIGKTAVTFAFRGSKKGIRITVKPDFYDVLSERYPEYSGLFQKVVRDRSGTEEDMTAFKIKGREASFGLLELPFDACFDCAEIEPEIPAYAPIVDSLTCSQCGERFMGSKAVERDSRILCRVCGGLEIPCLTGKGIDQD